MNSIIMMIVMLSSLYEQKCILINFEEGSSIYDKPMATLGIDRRYKEIEIQGKIKLRGPHLIQKFKETLSNHIDFQYVYIDNFPSIDQYVKNLRDAGMPLDMQRLMYETMLKNRKS